MRYVDVLVEAMVNPRSARLIRLPVTATLRQFADALCLAFDWCWESGYFFLSDMGFPGVEGEELSPFEVDPRGTPWVDTITLRSVFEEENDSLWFFYNFEVDYRHYCSVVDFVDGADEPLEVSLQRAWGPAPFDDPGVGTLVWPDQWECYSPMLEMDKAQRAHYVTTLSEEVTDDIAALGGVEVVCEQLRAKVDFTVEERREVFRQLSIGMFGRQETLF